MQFSGGGKQPVGLVYHTSMDRPDAALALALMFGYEGKREARVFAIGVAGSGLGAAEFVDTVAYFYARGNLSNSNRFLPVGLAADGPLPADPAIVKLALERRNDKGEPAYKRGVRRVSDTSEMAAMTRNAVTGIQDGNAVIVLSGPATQLARCLSLPGTRTLMAAKVRTLVIADATPAPDIPALRRVLVDWPGEIVLAGREIGDSLPFPGSSIQKDFAWAPEHPVVDAYRAFKSEPYDVPGWDLAAVFYAIHPELNLFDLSDPGTLQVSDEGRLTITPSPEGKHRALRLNPANREKLLQAYVEVASAKPVERQRPNRRPADAAAPPKPIAAPAAPPAKQPN